MQNQHQKLIENKWFFLPKPEPDAKLRLFCFAYAGGSASVFRLWPEALPNSIEICAIQLPGRGARFKEPVCSSMEEILNSLEKELGNYLDTPYAFFGHSMGATVAFELARRIQQNSQALPSRLILSGRRPPNFKLPEDYKFVHELPKKEFIEKLKKLNGTPDVLLENSDLMDLMEPTLRADFKVIETWQFAEGEKLNVPLSVFSGKGDHKINTNELNEWKSQTNSDFEVQLFDGDHFYLDQNSEVLLAQISRLLGSDANLH